MLSVVLTCHLAHILNMISLVNRFKFKLEKVPNACLSSLCAEVLVVKFYLI